MSDTTKNASGKTNKKKLDRMTCYLRYTQSKANTDRWLCYGSHMICLTWNMKEWNGVILSASLWYLVQLHRQRILSKYYSCVRFSRSVICQSFLAFCRTFSPQIFSSYDVTSQTLCKNTCLMSECTITKPIDIRISCVKLICFFSYYYQQQC